GARTLRHPRALVTRNRRAARRRRVRPSRRRARTRRAGAGCRQSRAAPAEPRLRLPREDGTLARRPRRRRVRSGMRTTADQVLLLARRSVVHTARQPAAIVFPLLFPMLLLAVNSGGLKAETHLPGFPTRSFVAFALAVPFIQGALFATMNAGTDLARDVQTGFLNRLSLTPLRGAALLAGQLGGVIVLGVVQACFYLAVGFAAGVRPKAG